MRFNRFWRYRRFLLSPRFAVAVWRSRGNLLAANRSRKLTAGPYLAELDITYRCNCRCRMCQRWQDSRDAELTSDEYRKLAADFKRLGVHQVTIAGGEPLMRKDAFMIIRAFAGSNMVVNLCTNGLLVEDRIDEICSAGVSCVTLSLDGATAECHDRIRGVSGSLALIENGIRALVAQKRRPFVRLRMALSNRNVQELRSYYHKWANIVDDVLIQPVHHCRDAYYTGHSAAEFRLDPDRLAEQLDGTPFKRDHYMRGLAAGLRRDGTYPVQPCHAGVLMARIDPWGNVFPCLEQHVRIGSVREQDFPVIWNSISFLEERKRTADDGQCTCWYNNTALISHYGKWLALTSATGLWQAFRHQFGGARAPQCPFEGE
jgi:MoaA/NifB/PqqE/SkfB family radical SAM enzyme